MRERLIKILNSSKTVLFGLFLLVIFILAMKQPEPDKRTISNGCSYLALGDSYTIGEQVPFKENFPNQVAALLNEKETVIAEPEIIAQTGWTTDELQAAVKKAKLSRQFDFVTLLIGVNNQYRGRKAADYIQEFEALLKEALRLARNDHDRVIVLSIPDWGVTPFAEGRDRKQIAKEIDEYNTANKLVAEKYNVHYIDITKSTREAANDPSFLTSDSLHPSGKEYAKWAKEVAELIEGKLK